ncbi:MAG TPA: alpha-amylase family protein [Solirubrobacteraceae bacterium]|nr:alpha-amylase family protein [Solirubrobacteraceae bacterium]
MSLRFRQIHMDFHTSEHIAGVGSAFDPEEFADTLVRAHVDSVTCFARCHHGWIYYDTTLHPERRHPHLERNLLQEQIAACHARGVRVPIYTTVQWDHHTAAEHPEWRIVTPDGALEGTPPFEAGFYRKLCLNSPYVGFLQDHVREIQETLPVDGLFFDIVQTTPCACRWCVVGMAAAELDPEDPVARDAFAQATIDRFRTGMSAFVRQATPEATIFYNAGHVGPGVRATAGAYTHFELESLPSGLWGYEHFPVTQRYARTLGRETLGHTGKFHTMWGDFHSFKNRAALEYECLRMLSLGSKCLIGDQLHPDGRIDSHVYDLVGAVYAEVEAKEPWCAGARPVSEIAVFTPEEFEGGGLALSPAIRGVNRILEELGHQFDIVDSQSDLGGYAVAVLPDHIPVSPALREKLEAFIAGGGRVLASFASGLDPQSRDFALAALGVRRTDGGPLPAFADTRHDHCDYLLPHGAVAAGLPATEHAMYLRGLAVETAGGEVLADRVEPYFDRTWRHFCSHLQTPSSGRRSGPAIVRGDGTVYFAHPVFSQYDENAPRWCKTLVANALALLLPEPLVRHDGPSSLRAGLTEQPAERRWVLHLLHYVPERRGRRFDTIEDVIPLHDLRVSVRVPAARSVTLAPGGEPVPYDVRDGRVDLRVERLDGHALVAFELGEA